MIREEAYQMAVELIETANPRRGALMVIGCSTSEVTGNKIGTASVPEVAEELYQLLSMGFLWQRSAVSI